MLSLLKKNKKRNVSIYIGLLLFVVILMSSIFANVIAPYSPTEQNFAIRLEAPSIRHILGTDQFGRDVFSRALYGGRKTLVSAFLAMSFNLFFGTSLGIIAGYYNGKWIDKVIMRIVDCLMAFPFIVLAMIISSLFGTELIHLMFAIILVWWIPFARLARSVVLKTIEDTDILAAKVSGAKDGVIMFKELLPKTIHPVCILATFELGSLILSMSALSFFGLGVKPPIPEWGSMLADSKAYFFQAPYLTVGISSFIFLMVLSLNLMGEGFRDQLSVYENIRI
jgi:peptide/nickel transport system permease protein